jgi:hypothetical protein
MTMPDIARLNAVLDYITDHPEQHRQQYWRAETECGTTMCFAGHTAALFGPEAGMTGWGKPIPMAADERMYGDVQVGDTTVDVETFACDLLGLDWDQGNALFYCMNGVDDLRRIVDDLEAGLI